MELYKKEEYFKIVGLCMEVHRILGGGLLEIVYKDALEYEFKKNNIPFERERSAYLSKKTCGCLSKIPPGLTQFTRTPVPLKYLAK